LTWAMAVLRAHIFSTRNILYQFASARLSSQRVLTGRKNIHHHRPGGLGTTPEIWAKQWPERWWWIKSRPRRGRIFYPPPPLRPMFRPRSCLEPQGRLQRTPGGGGGYRPAPELCGFLSVSKCFGHPIKATPKCTRLACPVRFGRSIGR
jgi:hypothetical protein